MCIQMHTWTWRTFSLFCQSQQGRFLCIWHKWLPPDGCAVALWHPHSWSDSQVTWAPVTKPPACTLSGRMPCASANGAPSICSILKIPSADVTASWQSGSSQHLLANRPHQLCREDDKLERVSIYICISDVAHLRTMLAHVGCVDAWPVESWPCFVVGLNACIDVRQSPSRSMLKVC